MGRVERTGNPDERSDQARQAGQAPRRDTESVRRSNPGHTETKAEGEERDVDEALERDTKR